MRERAFTLLEALAVVTILAIVGLAATLYTGSVTTAVALDGATHEVAEALRFARSEAMRRAAPRGLRVLSVSGVVEVFEPTPGAVSVAATLRDPISKRPYRIDLRELPGCRRLAIRGTPQPFGYAGLGSGQSAVLFDARGAPHFLQAGARHGMSAGQVVLELDGLTRSVSLSPIGRVTVP